MGDWCYVCGGRLVEVFNVATGETEPAALYALESSASIDSTSALPMRDGRVLVAAVSSMEDTVCFSEVRAGELRELSSLKINHGNEYRRFRTKFDAETATLLLFVPGEGIGSVDLVNLDQVHQPRFLELPVLDAGAADPLMDVFVSEGGAARVAGETVKLCVIVYSGSAIKKHRLSCPFADVLPELPELLARLRALLRRSQAATSAVLNFGPLELDTAGRRAAAAEPTPAEALLPDDAPAAVTRPSRTKSPRVRRFGSSSDR